MYLTEYEPSWQLASLLPRLAAWRRDRKTTFLLASSWPHEGKTSICIDLGRMAANAGQKVLLVDGDFLCPALSRHFECSGYALRDCLQRKRPLFQAIQPNLDLLGLERADHTLNLQPSQEARAFFRDCVEHYDLVLIDTPALSASSAAFPLASMADGVILIVSKRAFRDKGIDDLPGMFLLQGTEILGVIVTHESALLNGPPPRSTLDRILTGLGLKA